MLTKMPLPDKTEFRLGLTGYSLEHSLSPKIHTAALRACSLEGDYSLYPVPSNDQGGLKELLTLLRNGKLQGLNVTIPHKQSVIPWLDELTPTAKAIGAVNTIHLRDGKLVGENTDAAGFLSDLKQLMAMERQRHEGSKALVLGAGGSARAVVYALTSDRWKVVVVSRRIQQAQELAIQFENVEAVEFDSQVFQSANFQLVVNATPLGMAPTVEQSPWPENIPLPNAAIYDLVYNPRETKLIRVARAQGLRATTGLGMLVEQAALAFEIWTSRCPSRDILFESVNSFP